MREEGREGMGERGVGGGEEEGNGEAGSGGVEAFIRCGWRPRICCVHMYFI